MGSTIYATPPIHGARCNGMQSDCAWRRITQQAMGGGGKFETVDSIQQVVANGRFRSGSDAIGHHTLGQPAVQLGGRTSLGTFVAVQTHVPSDCRVTETVPPVSRNDDVDERLQVIWPEPPVGAEMLMVQRGVVACRLKLETSA